MRLSVRSLPLLLSVVTLACDNDPAGVDNRTTPPGGNTGIVTPPAVLTALGVGSVQDRFTAELSVRGAYAYTSSWGKRVAQGNMVKLWNVTGNPTLVDSLVIPSASTTGDVQISDDGTLLVVATEYAPGTIVIYSLADPAHPTFVSRFHSINTEAGVHTAEVARVGGTQYAFLSVDRSNGFASRLVIVDLSDPANPREVFALPMGNPFIHDVFVRDGVLFTALWNDGVGIWDIGGGSLGGTPANPRAIVTAPIIGGKAHNIWWYHEAGTAAKRYVFVGEEGPATLFTRASGDVHVIDISNLSAPREVAVYSVLGAGTHNFSVDEEKGILYAAFYNGGVRALDVRGDLSACDAAHKRADGRCDLGLMGREIGVGLAGQGSVFVWGVQAVGRHVFATDMLAGLWKLDAGALNGRP